LGNQSGEGLIGGFEVEHFARPVIEAFGDFVEIVLAVPTEISALGQILPDQPV
jgi:hypothetical protein